MKSVRMLSTLPVFLLACALMACGSRPDMAEVQKAIKIRQADVLAGQFKLGLDANAPFEDPESGIRLLHKAAEVSDKQIVQMLLDHGAEVNARDKFGRTPLLIAAEAGQAEIVETLLAGKAEINAQSAKGYTPLIATVRIISSNWESIPDAKKKDTYSRYYRTLEVLQAHGADVNLKDSAGKTPRDYASEKKMADALQILEKQGGKSAKP